MESVPQRYGEQKRVILWNLYNTFQYTHRLLYLQTTKVGMPVGFINFAINQSVKISNWKNERQFKMYRQIGQ